MPSIAPTAPAKAVFTIGTLRVPSLLSRAMVVASTVASRLVGKVSEKASGGSAMLIRIQPPGLRPSATAGPTSVGSKTIT
jgi:hypothetical protein